MDSNTQYASSDFLKKLVGESLDEGEGNDPDVPQSDEGKSDMYGLPPANQPEAQFIQQVMAQQANGASKMGPRFQEMINGSGLGSVAKAAAPAAEAATYGMTNVAPGAPAMMKGFQNMSIRPPQGENNFTNSDPPANINELRERLGFIESSGNYHAKNNSGAAGKYQYMPGTWNKYGGYDSADQAPPQIQDQRAHEDLANRLFATGGDVPKTVGTHLYPKYANDITKWNTPVPGNGTETIASYVSKVLGKATTQKYIQDQLAKKATADHSNQSLYNLAAR